MPIQPMTSGIEIVKFEAVNSGIGVAGVDLGPVIGEINDYLGLGLGETNVYINAKDMLGVDMIGSWHSDANLVIQNMTTQDNSGIARDLSDLTVVMGYTGNSDSHWSESDLSVYFDQDYLNPSATFTQAQHRHPPDERRRVRRDGQHQRLPSPGWRLHRRNELPPQRWLLRPRRTHRRKPERRRQRNRNVRRTAGRRARRDRRPEGRQSGQRRAADAAGQLRPGLLLRHQPDHRPCRAKAGASR